MARLYIMQNITKYKKKNNVMILKRGNIVTNSTQILIIKAHLLSEMCFLRLIFLMQT